MKHNKIQATRSGLKPAKLKTAPGTASEDIEVRFMFNPTEYELSKTNEWAPQEQSNAESSTLEFKKTTPIEVTLTLHFDTLMEEASREQPYDVRKHTDLLWKMMELQPQQNSQTQKAPPLVEFMWGELTLLSVITSMKQKFTLFMEDGTPTRAVVTVTLKQHNPEQSIARDLVAPEPVTVIDSSRADLIAAMALGMVVSAVAPAVSAGAGEVAQATREVMADNGIDNPLSLQTGVDLIIGG